MARDVSWRVPKRRLFSTPIPAQTRTYKPVSHKNLAKATLKAIIKAGFTLDKEEYYSAREGLVATARYTIKDVRDEDMQLEIGWQNSYDKTLSVKFAIGTRIMICSNGCVSGNFGSFARKHMSDVQTFAPEEMAKSIKDAAKVFDKIVEQKNQMKSVVIGVDRQCELVGKLFFIFDSFGSTQLNIVKEEMKTPTHDYGAPGSIWEIYQYVTFAMKDLHPRLWIDAHIEIHNYFLVELKDQESKDDSLKDLDSFERFKSICEAKGLNEDQALEIIDES